MTTKCSKLAEINRRNQEFWLKQSELLNRRMQNKTLYTIAMHFISSEAAMLTPVKCMQSLEQVFAHADFSRTTFHADLSSKGGEVAKADALQGLIEKLVIDEPEINTRQLMFKLRRMAQNGHPVVRALDQLAPLLPEETRKVHFEDNGECTAPISGLKDRLYRAKKKQSP